MLDIFTHILDTLFPPPDSVLRLRPISSESFVRLLQPSKVGKAIFIASYHHPLIKAAVVANKFHDSQKAAQLLGTLFDTWFKEHTNNTPTLFIPIPLSQERKKSRGYNQVERILENAPCAKENLFPLLIRTVNSSPQTSLHRTQRLTNIRGIFSYLEHTSIKNYARIIVVDDVTTTGATLDEALLVLTEKLGSSHQIIGVAIAH